MTAPSTAGCRAGGYFTCSASLCCRQVWMYCTLYSSLDRFKTDEVREAAVQGGDFLIKHVRLEGGKCAFSTDRYFNTSLVTSSQAGQGHQGAENNLL